MKKLCAIASFSFLLMGCSSKNFLEHTVEVEPTEQQIQSVCVKHNSKVKIPLDIYIKDVARKNGYEVVNKNCDAEVEYVALRYFDFHAPLANATVTVLDKDNDQVGYVFYQQPRNMWTSSDYFRTDEEILLPILENLFPEKSGNL